MLLQVCIYFIAGVDYVPVSERITFTPFLPSRAIPITTIEDEDYENNGEPENICLRLTELIEPCPDSVILGNDTTVQIIEDDRKLTMYICA